MREATADPTSDGRRARRERNRAAVIEATLELLLAGHEPPAVEDVAERAQVSVSSVFRYFENLDELQQQTIDRYLERYASLFELPPAADADRHQRIDTFVRARLDLYETIAPIARFARARAGDQPRLAATLDEARRSFATQVRDHFAPDLAERGRADADDRVALVDALTAFEAWDLLRGTHRRSRPLIQRAWHLGIDAVVARP